MYEKWLEGGYDGHSGSIHTVADWAREVRELRGPMCERCGEDTRALGGQAHHVFPRSERPDLETALWNGRWLCEACHYGFTHGRHDELNRAWQTELIERHVADDDGHSYLQPWHAIDELYLMWVIVNLRQQCPGCGAHLSNMIATGQTGAKRIAELEVEIAELRRTLAAVHQMTTADGDGRRGTGPRPTTADGDGNGGWQGRRVDSDAGADSQPM